MMNYYDQLCDFQNLYAAHLAARRGKREKIEVIDFEMNLAENLCGLQQRLKSGTYRQRDYYRFEISDPKPRTIYAPHYEDRVVQHCLCDNILAPVLENRLIYDNAACRIEKGTHFSIDRLCGFLLRQYKNIGRGGYFLKCDIKKYFENIDHAILKQKLSHLFHEEMVLQHIYGIIDSYESARGKGLPLGNQTSQWFALYYMDSLDRLIKERLRVKYYTRYMDDSVLVHEDKEFLQECLLQMRQHAHTELGLEFNEKTQIIPISNGIRYLGFHIYMTQTGKVIRKICVPTKKRFKKCLHKMMKEYSENRVNSEEVRSRVVSYVGHLRHGNTYNLRKKVLSSFVLVRYD